LGKCREGRRSRLVERLREQLLARDVAMVGAGGQTLMARLVPAGETVALTPALPVRLKIGNAQGTELLFRGQPVNLATTTRDNIANITLP
jgi:cytoskeleton protein RodZ